MFLGSISAPSPYDLRFRALGVPVRVTPWFWVAAVLLGWDHVHIADALELNRILVLGVWIAAVLLSILVHELGHSLMFRVYGVPSQIVLYHYGGMAIPWGGDGTGGYASRGGWRRIHISAAGPLAQLALGGMAMLFLGACFGVILIPWFGLQRVGLAALESHLLFLFITDLIVVSIYWALFNLLPIFPLDGGHIARELGLMMDPVGGHVKSLILSLITASCLAAWFFSTHNVFSGMLIASLAVGNYQELQGAWEGGRGRW